ncbi:Nicotinate phosphoribosyltransferase [Grifola frondosa]|uniref:nicotinate phosphoribosyltransferase n=1 Tax=Grifola frondosa TaxID=5627 RepID=A0A1C7M8D7_GRIFR|nr:Nicotinate phosphoribosyltransferase [Grifola frondosa]
MSITDSGADNGVVLPASILDTDLYKFTMQQAVLHHFPDVHATYKFTHRDKDVFFPRHCFERFKLSVSHFGELRLSDTEHRWLAEACPYFSPDYLQYVAAYRFKTDQVHLEFEPVSEDGRLGNIHIEAGGPWVETILWEVPLMACLSEIYFKTVDTDWNYDGQEVNSARDDAAPFTPRNSSCRASSELHEIYPEREIVRNNNVYLAFKYGVTAVGTIAHEWFMAVGALRGYEHANAIALNLWEDVYPEVLHLALTDTFSTEAFYKDFLQNKEQAVKWAGLRQDSGDPFIYAPRAKEVYMQLNIDYHKKMIIFSDA